MWYPFHYFFFIQTVQYHICSQYFIMTSYQRPWSWLSSQGWESSLVSFNDFSFSKNFQFTGTLWHWYHEFPYTALQFPLLGAPYTPVERLSQFMNQHGDLVIKWDCSPPGSAVRGTLQARTLDGLPRPPAGDLPDPEIKLAFPASPALQADSVPTDHLGSPCY